MTAFHHPRPSDASERALAAARRLLRENGPAAMEIAERRGDEARETGNRAALHHWRRTARCLAALTGYAPPPPAGRR